MDEANNTPLEPQGYTFSEGTSGATGGGDQVGEAAAASPATSENTAAQRIEAASAANLESLVVPMAANEPLGANTSGASPSAEADAAEKGISIISGEATILGDIITEGHIDVIGKVRGNIAAQGDVAVHGQVRGNIDGEKIGLYNSRVKGNLTAGQGVIVNNTSIIDGDVTTKNIIFDGKVRGSIAAESVVVLRSNSYCLGDVTAASLAVEPGAVINGTVRTLIDGDPEAPFEEIF